MHTVPTHRMQELHAANRVRSAGVILRSVILDNLTEEQRAKLVLVRFSFAEETAVSIFNERNVALNTNKTVFKIPCMFMGKKVGISIAVDTRDAVQEYVFGVEVDTLQTMQQFVEAMAIMGVHL